MQRRVVAAAVVAGLGLAAALPAISTSADWPRYGGDDAVTNYIPPERAAGLSSDTVGELVERWAATIGGRFVASPLYAEDIRFGDHTEDVVYAATNAGTVAALRAEDGQVLWKRQVSGTVATTCNQTYGISSTPVLDRTRDRVYVIGADGLLQALDLSTGAPEPGWPVRIVSRTGSEYTWGGLAMVGTRVYVPVASYCDKPDADGYMADGRLVAVDVVDPRIAGVFDVVDGPNNMGGIWGYGGTSVDQATGELWTTTGNSWVYDPTCDCIVETVGYGESVVKLDPNLGVLDWNRPEGIPYVEDNDFGAAPLLFQPAGCPPLAAANSKNGKVYVWIRDGLGGGPYWSARAGPDNLGSAFLGQPSFSPASNTIYISDARDYDEFGAIRTFDAVVAFTIGPGCRFPDRPTWTAPGIGAGPKTPPLVVDDLVFVPGGFDRAAFALDARTGATLWSVGLPGAVLAPIGHAGELVLVADSSGVVHAFGLPRPTRGPGGRYFIPV